MSLALALLTLGLVRPWGEVVPRWVPVIGGRPAPLRAATIPATVGATAVAALTVHQLLHQAFDIAGPLEPLPPGCTLPGAEILVFLRVARRMGAAAVLREPRLPAPPQAQGGGGPCGHDP